MTAKCERACTLFTNLWLFFFCFSETAFGNLYHERTILSDTGTLTIIFLKTHFNFLDLNLFFFFSITRDTKIDKMYDCKNHLSKTIVIALQ